MAGILDKFRDTIKQSVLKEESPDGGVNIDDKIALGVLLWMVAQADKKFLAEEEQKIKDILKNYGKLPDNDLPVVLASIRQAERNKIDLYTFTREVSKDLPYSVKAELVDQLFRVACADNDLDNEEHEMIRKISGLLGVDHKDFIESKIRVKKEFGMRTA